MNDAREKGIQAVIDLQATAGVEEPRETAEKNWDAFSDNEKSTTMSAHRAVCPDKYKN